MGIDTTTETDASVWNERIFGPLNTKLNVLFSGCSPFYALIPLYPSTNSYPDLFPLVMYHGTGTRLFSIGIGDDFGNLPNWTADQLREILSYDEGADYGDPIIYDDNGTLRILFGWYNIRYHQGALDLVFENVDSFIFTSDPDRFRFYRLHNISNNTLTVTFPQGVVTIPARGVKAVRLSETEILDQSYEYLWAMRQGDVICWDVSTGFLRGNNTLAPCRVLDWMRVFRSLGRMSFGWFFDGPNDDLRSLYSSLFGNHLNASTKLGDLLHFKGSFTHGGNTYSFRGYDTIETDIAGDLTVTYDENGWLIDGAGSLVPVTTNLFGIEPVELPVRPQFEIELDWHPVHIKESGGAVFFNRDMTTPITMQAVNTVQGLEDRLRLEGYTIGSKGLDENGFYWIVQKVIDYTVSIQDSTPELNLGTTDERAEWENQQIKEVDLSAIGWTFKAIVRFKNAGFPSGTDARLWAYPRLAIENIGAGNPTFDRDDGVTWDSKSDTSTGVKYLGPVTNTNITPGLPTIDQLTDGFIYRYAGPDHPLLSEYVAVPCMVEQFNRLENLVARATRCFPLQLSDIYRITQGSDVFTSVPTWLGQFVPQGCFAVSGGNLSRWVNDFGILSRNQAEWQEAIDDYNDNRKEEEVIIGGIPFTLEYYWKTEAVGNIAFTYTGETTDGTTWERTEDASVSSLTITDEKVYSTLTADFNFYGQTPSFYHADDVIEAASTAGMPQLYYRSGVPLKSQFVDDYSEATVTWTGSDTSIFRSYNSEPLDWGIGSRAQAFSASWAKEFMRLYPVETGFQFIGSGGTRFDDTRPLESNYLQDEVYQVEIYTGSEDATRLRTISKSTPNAYLKAANGKYGLRVAEWKATSGWVNNSKVITFRIPWTYKEDRWNEASPWDETELVDNTQQHWFTPLNSSPTFYGDDMTGQEYAFIFWDFYLPC